MSDVLFERLNYQFHDPNLLKMALTHRSKAVTTMNVLNIRAMLLLIL